VIPQGRKNQCRQKRRRIFVAIFYEDMTRENESEGGQERLQRGNEAAAPFIEKKHSPLFVCILKVASRRSFSTTTTK
jgi:hypothetical protein